MTDHNEIIRDLQIETARTQLADAQFVHERRKQMAVMEDERHEAALRESAATAASHEAHEHSQQVHAVAQEAMCRASESTIAMNASTTAAYDRIAAAVERMAVAIEKAVESA